MGIEVRRVNLGEDLARRPARNNADSRGTWRARRPGRTRNDPEIENRRGRGPDIVDRRRGPVRQGRNRPDRNRCGVARGTLRPREARIDNDRRGGRGRRGQSRRLKELES
jgi:hypothetical protein